MNDILFSQLKYPTFIRLLHPVAEPHKLALKPERKSLHSLLSGPGNNTTLKKKPESWPNTELNRDLAVV